MKKGKLFGSALCAGLAFAGALSFAQNANAATVEITDPELGKALAAAEIWGSDGVWSSDLVYNEAGHYFVEDPSDIWLIRFDCGKENTIAKVADWSQFAIFDNLEVLYACETNSIDWQYVNNDLYELNIFPMYRMSIDSFSDRDDLLALAENKAVLGAPVDMSWVSRFQNLKQLYIAGTTIRNLDHIKDLPYLESLFLVNTGLQDISGINEMPELSNIFLPINEIRNMEELVEFGKRIQPGSYEDVSEDRQFWMSLWEYAPFNEATFELNDYTAETPALVLGWINSFDQATNEPNHKGGSGAVKGPATRGPSDEQSLDDYIVMNGVSLSANNGTITIDPAVANPNIKIGVFDDMYMLKANFVVNEQTDEGENPNTFDSSLAYLLGGISAAAIAGFGILNALKHRR